MGSQRVSHDWATEHTQSFRSKPNQLVKVYLGLTSARYLDSVLKSLHHSPVFQTGKHIWLMEHLGKSRGLRSWRKWGNDIGLWHSPKDAWDHGSQGHRDRSVGDGWWQASLVTHSINSLLICYWFEWKYFGSGVGGGGVGSIHSTHKAPSILKQG